MWYWILGVPFAVWVLVDGRRRSAAAGLWALGTFFAYPLTIPIYLAVRPLRAGETREGGRAWNILKNFAMAWTVVMALLALLIWIATRSGGQSALGDLGPVFVVAIGMLWFFPMLGAIVLGYFLRKPNLVERGSADA